MAGVTTKTDIVSRTSHCTGCSCTMAKSKATGLNPIGCAIAVESAFSGGSKQLRLRLTGSLAALRLHRFPCARNSDQ
jgi:coenzyme F420-reducing hydrogenase gamma subunit